MTIEGDLNWRKRFPEYKEPLHLSDQHLLDEYHFSSWNKMIIDYVITRNIKAILNFRLVGVEIANR